MINTTLRRNHIPVSHEGKCVGSSSPQLPTMRSTTTWDTHLTIQNELIFRALISRLPNCFVWKVRECQNRFKFWISTFYLAKKNNARRRCMEHLTAKSTQDKFLSFSVRYIMWNMLGLQNYETPCPISLAQPRWFVVDISSEIVEVGCAEAHQTISALSSSRAGQQ